MTTSRWRVTKHVQHVSPYSLASIDLGFVEIGLVQLSQMPITKNPSVASFLRPSFLFDSSSEKKRKNKPITATSNRHSDLHNKVSHSFKTARPRWKESQIRSEVGKTFRPPLWARHRLGQRESAISEKVQTSPCSAAFSREPQKDHKSDGGHSTSYLSLIHI